MGKTQKLERGHGLDTSLLSWVQLCQKFAYSSKQKQWPTVSRTSCHRRQFDEPLLLPTSVYLLEAQVLPNIELYWTAFPTIQSPLLERNFLYSFYISKDMTVIEGYIRALSGRYPRILAVFISNTGNSAPANFIDLASFFPCPFDIVLPLSFLDYYHIFAWIHGILRSIVFIPINISEENEDTVWIEIFITSIISKKIQVEWDIWCCGII